MLQAPKYGLVDSWEFNQRVDPSFDHGGWTGVCAGQLPVSSDNSFALAVCLVPQWNIAQSRLLRQNFKALGCERFVGLWPMVIANASTFSGKRLDTFNLKEHQLVCKSDNPNMHKPSCKSERPGGSVSRKRGFRTSALEIIWTVHFISFLLQLLCFLPSCSFLMPVFSFSFHWGGTRWSFLHVFPILWFFVWKSL